MHREGMYDQIVLGDKLVQNELLCRNYEMLKHGAVECNDLESGGNIFDMG